MLMRLLNEGLSVSRFKEPVHAFTWSFEIPGEHEGRCEASMPSFTRS